MQRGSWLAALAVAAALSVAFVVRDVRHESRLRAPGPAVAVQGQIPRGACVLTDDPSLALAADRFVSDVAGCTPMVDPIGTDYALAHGRNGLTGAGRNPRVQAAWLSALRHARYVWLDCGPPRAASCSYANRRVPWTASVYAYFSAHFRLEGLPGFLYIRDRA